MSCSFPPALLALCVEGDLHGAQADAAARHLAQCAACRERLRRLEDSQAWLKSLRRETASRVDCAAMRRDVMARVEAPSQWGWMLRMERSLTLACRRHAYAMGCVLAAVVSAAVLADPPQPSVPAGVAAATYEHVETLSRPDYETWVLVSQPPDQQVDRGIAALDATRTRPRVYIDREGYRSYARTGAFAEGTMLIWESRGDTPGHPHADAPALLASVKDSSRFEGGWGYFDFGADRARATAEPAAESRGCRTCHVEQGETDSVFTQSYDVLRAARSTSVPTGMAG